MTDEGGSDFAMSIVRVACMLIIGVIVLGSIAASMGSGGHYTTITMATNPADGETLTLGDSIPMVFEFNNTGTVTEGNWAVTINNSSAAATRANLVASLNENTGYIITTSGDNIIVDGIDTNAETTATNITLATSTSTNAAMMDNITSTISSGYGLASLMIIALGAAGIMRYLGFI